MAFSEPPVDLLLARIVLGEECATIEIEGNLDHTSCKFLDAKIADVTRLALDGPTRIVLNISRLQFIDIDGVALILRGMEELRAVSTEFRVLYPSPMALQLLELCSFLQIAGIEFGPTLGLGANHSPSTAKRASEAVPPSPEPDHGRVKAQSST